MQVRPNKSCCRQGDCNLPFCWYFMYSSGSHAHVRPNTRSGLKVLCMEEEDATLK